MPATATIHPTQIIPDGPGAYLVPSRSAEGTMHYVRLNPVSCDCKGFAYRGQCAHVLSVVAMYQETAL